MSQTTLNQLFSISGLSVAITGGGGILCSEMAVALASLGCKVAVLDLLPDSAQRVAKTITDAGGQGIGVACDVLKRDSVQAAAEKINQAFGHVDVLINGAGGNKKDATTSDTLSFFDLPDSAFRWVFELNCVGTILPSQIFGKQMAQRKSGQIINISSMNAFRPLTKIPAYSAAKAAISNFTQWLAVHMAQTYSPQIRVNAIAPGFFLTEQNRFLLTEQATGNLTPRGQKVIDHTPAAKFGKPADLVGSLVWLMSPSAEFVTGIVVPIDGGFSAYAGV